MVHDGRGVVRHDVGGEVLEGVVLHVILQDDDEERFVNKNVTIFLQYIGAPPGPARRPPCHGAPSLPPRFA